MKCPCHIIILQCGVLHAWSGTYHQDKSKPTVTIILGGPNKLAFARPGDDNWTLIVKRIGALTSHEEYEAKMSDVIFFNEHFYAIDYGRRIYRCEDIGGTDPKIIVIATFARRRINFDYYYQDYYLVESLGGLFVVVRMTSVTKARRAENAKAWLLQAQDPKWRSQDVLYDSECGCEDGDDPESKGDWDVVDETKEKVDFSEHRVEDHVGIKTIYFEVFKVDMDERKLVRVKNLADRAFVLAWHTSFSVSATDIDGYRPNCIYFVDDRRDDQQRPRAEGHDNGVFCLEDGSIESIYTPPVESHDSNYVPTPLWLTLIPS